LVSHGSVKPTKGLPLTSVTNETGDDSRTVNEQGPIEGAYMIELAIVVAGSAMLRRRIPVGDCVVIYCENRLVPCRARDEFEVPAEVSSLRTMDEAAEGFRLRTVELRGQAALKGYCSANYWGVRLNESEGCTDELKVIVKFEAPVPACLGGEVVGPFPSFV